MRETRAYLGVRLRRFGVVVVCAGCVLACGIFEGCTTARLIDVRPLSVDSRGGPVRGWIARVNVSDPLVQVLVTGPLPPGDDQPGAEARLTPIDDWCVQQGAALAINANYFSTVPGDGTSAEYADIIGLSVSDGIVVSPSRSYGSHADPALIITGDRRARIAYIGDHDLDQVIAAVAGIGGSSSDPERGTLLVDDRINLGDTARVEPDKRHPRTAAGVSRDGRTLWLVVVDGRQPGWSVGMTLPELAELMIGLGVYDAVNMDGGGSSTLIYRSAPAAETFASKPSDKSGFRPVANALGFRLIDDIPAQQAIAASCAGE